jgi:hypothetical protein
MNEATGTFLDYEIAYRRERMLGLTAPRRAEHHKPATARLLRNRRARRAA